LVSENYLIPFEERARCGKDLWNSDQTQLREITGAIGPLRDKTRKSNIKTRHCCWMDLHSSAEQLIFG